MEDSPVKKKKKKAEKQRPKECIIHSDVKAHESTMSPFSVDSWKVRFSINILSFIIRSKHELLENAIGRNLR